MSNSEFRTPSQALEVPGFTLSAVATPVAVYVPATRAGNLVFTSSQLPFVNGELTYVSHVGAEVTAEEVKEAARTCALNTLAVVDAETGLDNAIRIVKAVGSVNSTAGLASQLGAINGASELFGDVFGERGQYARSAVGANQLSLDVPVEVGIIVEAVQ